MKFPVLVFSNGYDTPFSFLSLTENTVFESKRNRCNQYSRCVGSSHSWWVILNKSDLFLLDTVSRTCFLLPGNQIFPHIQRAREISTEEIKGDNKSFCHSLETVQEWVMVKAILSGNPSSNKKYAVITMYNNNCRSKLTLCRPGDKKWTGLDGEIDLYYDIICHENMLYALGDLPSSAGPSVEIWDLTSSSPKSKMIIQVPCPNLIEARKIYPTDLYTWRWYLIISSDELFFIVRYVGEFARYDGYGLIISDFISPYKTVGFHVYKLDRDEKQWCQVELLDDVALFIGGNQSVALPVKKHPGLKSSAIYFTDDYWDRMEEDIYYGGHDLGVFKLGDGSIEPLLESDQERFEPSPFWMVPK